MIKTKNKRGFTIIELLIYSVIVAMVLLAGTIFALEVIKGENKTRSIQEVQNNANYIIDMITKTIRLGDEIDTTQSVFNTNPGLLVINMSEPSESPTTFSVNSSNKSIEMRSGSSDPVRLNSAEVEITNLVFSNLTKSKAQANIKIELEVTYKNPDQISEFTSSFSITQSASIRK